MSGQRVLVVAPHSDDECLGAGGAIAKLADAGAEIAVLTVCSELPPLFPESLRDLAHKQSREAHAILGVTHSWFLDLPAVEVSQGSIATLNRGVQDAVDSFEPTIALIPFPDRHVDHKAAFDAAMVATRPVRKGVAVELVAMYEVISETYFNAPGAEPTFSPNWTVDIESSIDRKIDAFKAMSCREMHHPGPRSPDALRALAVFRGSQSSFAFGESYQIARSTFNPTSMLSLSSDQTNG